jgi:hypothetical protein
LILLAFTNPKVDAHLHQMPTLIDCLIFKDLSLAAPDFRFRFFLRNSLTNRFVRQQQRNEIMNTFLKLVNFFFTSFLLLFARCCCAMRLFSSEHTLFSE